MGVVSGWRYVPFFWYVSECIWFQNPKLLTRIKTSEIWAGGIFAGWMGGKKKVESGCGLASSAFGRGRFCGLISCLRHRSLFAHFWTFLSALSTWNLTLHWIQCFFTWSCSPFFSSFARVFLLWCSLSLFHPNHLDHSNHPDWCKLAQCRIYIWKD